MEFWLHGFAVPGKVAELARHAEAWGFRGLLLADSQNLTADIWVELCLAAAATSDLHIGPGVTNPVTRHLAVTASAALTLQLESNGRVSLGFGQGDSALSQIGLSGLRVAEFERALETLQAFLRGDAATLPGAPTSRIRWLAADTPKVPMHVAATGPRTIAAAARHAEGVDLTVGGSLDRLRSGVMIARNAAPTPIQIGAYLNVAVDPDPALARELVRGSVATFARFTKGATTEGYDADLHGQARAGFAQTLPDAFIDQFAVTGTPEQVRSRLRAIEACGIERVIVVPGSLDSDADTVRNSCNQFAQEVIPRTQSRDAAPASG